MERSLPENWVPTELGEVLDDIVGGGTPSKEIPEYFQGDIPLMTVKDMKVSRPKGAGFNITQQALENSSSKIIPADTVIIATRMGLGKVVRPLMSTAINQDLKALFPSKALDKSYLEQWLISIADRIEAMGTGTTVKGIRLNQVRELQVPLAPIVEQRRIVEKIETLFSQLDAGEAALRQVQTLLARYRQSVLKAAVTGALTAEEAFKRTVERVTLGDLLIDIRYGTAKKCYSNGAGIAVLRIPNVAEGKVTLSDLKFAELADSDVSKLALERGDLLLVRSNGSANLVGRAAVVTHDAIGLAFAGYLIRLRIDQMRILPEFLKLLLDSPEVREKIEREARSTSGVHNINSGEVKAIAFELPTIDVQRKILLAFDEAMNGAEYVVAGIESELTRSAALRQSILKDAFSGKLVPQDPSDEPASALLARIRAERANAEPMAKRRGRLAKA